MKKKSDTPKVEQVIAENEQLRKENGNMKSQIQEAIAILESGTKYEKRHVVGILNQALTQSSTMCRKIQWSRLCTLDGNPVCPECHKPARMGIGIMGGPCWVHDGNK